MARREIAIREEDNSKVPTIYTALDLGRRRWTVGMLLPGDRDARLFQIAGGDREALSELIRRQRQMVGDPSARESTASACVASTDSNRRLLSKIKLALRHRMSRPTRS